MREDINLSAGHYNNDPGAVNKFGVKEADLTKELRDLIYTELLKYENAESITTDHDWETNSQYQLRLRNKKTDEIAVTFDIHFNAAGETATGTETIISKNASKTSIAFGTEIQAVAVKVLGLKDRGVLTEDKTPRGRLGILNIKGIAALIEVCFITNENDLKRYHSVKKELACELARVIHKFNKMVNYESK